MVVAASPDEWLVQRAQAGMRALISYEPTRGLRQDRQLAGLIGHGGTWKLLLEGGDKTETWTADWEVGQQQHPAQRIWRVRYTLSGEPTELKRSDSRPLDSVISDLQQALMKIIEFCSDHKLEARVFRKSLECLSATHPLELIPHPDLCPDGLLARPALQVLAASQAAWVFGTMGSWNDLGFDGSEQDRYESVSDDLFKAINEAVVSSVNSVERRQDRTSN